MAEHMAPETGWMRLTVALVTYTHRLGAKDAAQSLTRVALRTRVNKQGLWEAGFVASKGWGGYHKWMFWACLNYMGCHFYSEIKGTVHDPLDQKGCLTGVQYPMEAEWGG